MIELFINKDSLIINGISMGQYLIQVEYQYPKLWGKDSGRNLAGDQSGTLLGVFPKLILQFRKLSKEELQLLAPIFDSQYQNVTYYDPVKQTSTTMKTYTGDWSVVNKGIGRNENFQISFIATSRRR